MKSQITTGKVRLSYAYLSEPRAYVEGQTPKYSATLLIPKTDKETLQRIKNGMQAAVQNFKAKNPGKKLPAELKNTLHDGDGLTESGEEFGPECKGHYVMTVSSTRKPVLVARDKTPIVDPEELYSGCYARCVLNFYVYDYMGKKGISAGLNGVMKWADGERLAGGGVSDDDWDDWEDEDDDAFDFLD